jgi:hypothetical protein
VIDELDLSVALVAPEDREVVRAVTAGGVRGADFRGARLRMCAMRGSSLDGVMGVESLRGLRMPWTDVLDSAAALAAAVGIVVETD